VLKNNYRIYIENTRLSGGYLSTGISMLMSADDESSSYLETARNDLLKAIHHGSKSQAAIQLLAHVYIIEKNYLKADSLLSILQNTASVYNDLGVLYAEQKEWGEAANQHQLALNTDSHFTEAYYNLALMKIKLGSTDDAISLLETYIRLETDTVWINAAQHILERIEQREGAT
jgi:Tfp pilus assembly protein PilF